MHEIRFCQYSELSLLKKFLIEHWKENHILALSSELFQWQHINKQDKSVNFVVAYNTITKEFDAILGFIPTSQYDNNIKDQDIWLAIWKVKEEFMKTGIGLEVFLFLVNKYKSSTIGAIGISEDAAKIYKAFKYEIGVLEHFYIKNEQCNENFIASLSQQNKENKDKREVNSFNVIKSINKDEFLSSNIELKFIPRKSKKYYINRYYKNPFYNYDFNGIIYKDNLISVFISRKVFVQNYICIRIVDWIGPFPKDMYYQFQIMLQENNAEYIDLLCKIPNKSELKEMGFKEKNPEKHIIPNYFEPFLKENVYIQYGFKSKRKNYAIFKGDSDQDRPNKIGGI